MPPACSLGDEAAVRALLDLGADPNAGGTATTLYCMRDMADGAAQGRLTQLLLQHGADWLLPPCQGSLFSLVACWTSSTMSDTAAVMLAHLERQRAAGQLELSSVERAAQLLLAATLVSHQQLFSYGLRCLEAHLAAAGANAGALGQTNVFRCMPQ